MSVAIRAYDPLNYEDTKSIIYFSATTSLSRDNSNTVPEHPVDKGFNISDTSSPNSSNYSVSGIISEVDLSGNTPYIASQLQNPIVNQNNFPQPVRLNDSNDSLVGGLINKFVPDFISQFLGNSVEIVVDESGKGWTVSDVRSEILRSMRGVRWNEDLERNETYPLFIELFLLDSKGNLREKIAKDLLIESFNESSNEDSGEAMFFDMTFKEVRVVSQKTTTVNSSKVSPEMNNSASSKAEKGSQATTEATESEQEKVKEKRKTAVYDLSSGGGG